SGSMSGSLRAFMPFVFGIIANSRWHHAVAASIVAMASLAQQSLSAAPGQGFVMAMRARLTTAKAPPCYEWTIVSRWGAAGEWLSIGRTKLPALPGKIAPIHLTPRQTALAKLLQLPPGSGPPTFLFVQRKPVSMSVAGNFAP